MAEGHGDFERLAIGGVLFALDAAVLAGRNVKSQLVFVMDHDPVRTVIYPTFVGIAGNIHAPGANITAAVFVMPERRRELEHVDIAILIDVVEKRALLDELGG